MAGERKRHIGQRSLKASLTYVTAPSAALLLPHEQEGLLFYLACLGQQTYLA